MDLLSVLLPHLSGLRIDGVLLKSSSVWIWATANEAAMIVQDAVSCQTGCIAVMACALPIPVLAAVKC